MFKMAATLCYVDQLANLVDELMDRVGALEKINDNRIESKRRGGHIMVMHQLLEKTEFIRNNLDDRNIYWPGACIRYRKSQLYEGWGIFYFG